MGRGWPQVCAPAAKCSEDRCCAGALPAIVRIHHLPRGIAHGLHGEAQELTGGARAHHFDESVQGGRPRLGRVHFDAEGEVERRAGAVRGRARLVRKTGAMGGVARVGVGVGESSGVVWRGANPAGR